MKWSFSFLNAIRISKVPGHYINPKMQYSTALTAVQCRDVTIGEKGFSIRMETRVSIRACNIFMKCKL